MTSQKKEVAPVEKKTNRGDHEEGSPLTRPESYETAQGIESPYREADKAREPLPAHDCSLHFLLQRQPVGPWQVCYIPAEDDGRPREWRTFGPENIDELRRYLERVNKQNNVHWTVNPPRRTMVTKPCEADVIVHRAHVDVDLPPPPAGMVARDQVAAFLQAQLEAVQAQFERFVPKPTALVFTGGGYQAFWDFGEPVSDHAVVKAINEQIAQRFDGDGRRGDRCHSVDHLMRLPGTINYPKPSKVAIGRREALAQVVWDTGAKYRPDDFFAAGFTRSDAGAASDVATAVAKLERGEVARLARLDDLPASVGEKCRHVIELGRDADPDHYPSDSEPVYFVMMELRRCGVDPGLIVGIVTDPKWGVSKHVRKKRSEAKAIKYAWEQLERGAAKEQARPPLLSEHTPMESAREFVTRELRYLRRFRGDWYDYTGSCYRSLDDATVRARLYGFLEAAETWNKENEKRVPFCPNPTRVNAVEDALRSLVIVSGENYIDVARWLDNPGPSPNEVVACKNGLLHLPTRRLLPATPAFFTLNALDINYDPSAPEPREWLRFLKMLWKDDPQSIALLQEWFGYVVMRETDQQKILLLVGPPRSGKTTIARVVAALLGSANVAWPTMHSMANDFGTQQLLGKQLAIISEARVDARSPDMSKIVSLLLSISGEDEISVNRKHKDMLTVKLPVRIIIISNELPAVAESSGALSNRLLLSELTESFLGTEDKDLPTRLLRELPGILNWAFAGYERLKARGRFLQPDSGADLREQFEDMSSPVASFARDCCVFEDGAQMDKQVLYEHYLQHCSASGHRFKQTRQQFFGSFLAAFRGRVRNVRPGGEGPRPRILEGVRLRGPDDDKPDEPLYVQEDIPF